MQSLRNDPSSTFLRFFWKTAFGRMNTSRIPKKIRDSFGRWYFVHILVNPGLLNSCLFLFGGCNPKKNDTFFFKMDPPSQLNRTGKIHNTPHAKSRLPYPTRPPPQKKNNMASWNIHHEWVDVHPGRLTWNIIIEVGKIIFLSKWVMFVGSSR